MLGFNHRSGLRNVRAAGLVRHRRLLKPGAAQDQQSLHGIRRVSVAADRFGAPGAGVHAFRSLCYRQLQKAEGAGDHRRVSAIRGFRRPASRLGVPEALALPGRTTSHHELLDSLGAEPERCCTSNQAE